MAVEVVEGGTVGEDSVALAGIEIFKALGGAAGKPCYLAKALCQLFIAVEGFKSLRGGAHGHVLAVETHGVPDG